MIGGTKRMCEEFVLSNGLRVVAEPIRGSVPGLATYAAAFLVIGILFAITWPLYAKFRSRIVYWL